jgi:hypothetical protein
MPFTRKFSRLLPVGAVAALALVAAPAASAATTNPCGTQITAPVFAQFGDLADYYLAPGGSFEGSTIPWAKSGAASLAAGNEPWYLAGATNRQALRLQKDAKVTTPKLCVTRNEPYLRFVAKAVGSGQLDVEVRLYDANGQVTDSSSGGVSPSDHNGWRPSKLIFLKTDKLAAGQAGYIDVSFKSQGDWTIDDVFVDPYRS